jgi:hypothetical protein
MRDKLAALSTILGTLLAIASAAAMRDHIRLVEIVSLFFGGFGAGAGVALLVANRRLQRLAAERDPADRR